jgi:hypothetical protein
MQQNAALTWLDGARTMAEPWLNIDQRTAPHNRKTCNSLLYPKTLVNAANDSKHTLHNT